MVRPANGTHVVGEVEEDGERIVVMAIDRECSQGGGEVDNDSNELQDVDANQVFIGVILDKCFCFLMYFPWPLQMPPEEKLEAEAATAIQASITPRSRIWNPPDDVSQRR